MSVLGTPLWRESIVVFDHERIFITLGALFHVEGPVQDTDWIVKSSPADMASYTSPVRIFGHVLRSSVELTFLLSTAELSRQKDVQMLAMMSMVVLQAFDTRGVFGEHNAKSRS